MEKPRDLRSAVVDVGPAPGRADVLSQLKEDLATRAEAHRSALVEVEVSVSGKVTAVRIHRDWRKSLGPAALGEAVLDGYAYVVGQRITETAVTSLDDEAQRSDPTTTGRDRPSADSGTRQLPETVDRATRLADLRRALQENREQLDRLRELRKEVPADPGERRVTSPLGCFTATITRFGVVGIEGNAQAILGVPLHELQEDAVDLFEHAGVGEELHGGEGR